MKKSLPQKIFIAATDTGVGKTIISAILAQGLDAFYHKPIQCGIIPYTDTSWIKTHTSLNDTKFIPEKFLLKTSLSPHLASRIENKKISISDLTIPQVPENSYLIIEGCGGILVPLNEKELLIDLIKKMEIPVIIICRSLLGTINHTLMTISTLKSYNIEIFGIIMNGVNEDNANAIETYGKVPVLAQIEEVVDLDQKKISILFEKHFRRYVN